MQVHRALQVRAASGMMLCVAEDRGLPNVLTPDEQKQRTKDVASLLFRFGDLYRIREDENGMWWAERDGDKLSADGPVTLAIVIGDHMAYQKAVADGWAPPVASESGT